MTLDRNVTSRQVFATRPRWVALATTLMLSAVFSAQATAQCVDFIANVYTGKWDSRGAFANASKADSTPSDFSVNDVYYTGPMFECLFQLKVTGQAYRQHLSSLTHQRQIDGEALFATDGGYLVLQFNSDADAPYRNTGRFTITDAGGIYAGASGSGAVEIWMFQSPYSFGNSVFEFRTDPQF